MLTLFTRRAAAPARLPAADPSRPQEVTRAQVRAKGADHWNRLHVRTDRREGFLWPELRRSSHYQIPTLR